MATSMEVYGTFHRTFHLLPRRLPSTSIKAYIYFRWSFNLLPLLGKTCIYSHGGFHLLPVYLEVC